jgi:predicted phage terminase large subunit-like protein
VIDKRKAVKELRKLETNFFEFYKAAWSSIEGETPLKTGEYQKIICEHLELCSYGKVKKLIIGIPPRHSKTTLCSIMFLPWIWTTRPHLKFVYASYANKISLEHSRLCLMLLQSSWYQERWQRMFMLSKRQTTKSHFVNNHGGCRIATSVGAGTTALGGDFIIGDDLNEVNEGEVIQKSTTEWLTRAWPSRLNPGGLGVHIQIQQRTGVGDVTGSLLERDEKKEWINLCLPIVGNRDTRCKTVVIPSSDGKVWEDARKDDEILWPEVFTPEDIERRKQELGSWNWASQYLMRPVIPGGNILKKEWFKLFKKPKPPSLFKVIQSWDTAYGDKDESDHSACTTWGMFKNDDGVNCLILLSMWRGRVLYPELRERAKALHDDYTNTAKEILKPNAGNGVDMVLVESLASGAPLIYDLRKLGINAISFNPTRYGGKVERVHYISHFIEGGLVYVPAQPPNFDKPRKFAEEFISECEQFPKGTSRDVVDSMTQVFIHLKPWLSHPIDYKDIEKPNETHNFYGVD